MSTRSLRTANYSDEARARLAEAVSAARRAAGFKWRTNFARRHQGISVSSLAAVELSKPLVGVAVLEAIGTALGEHFPGRWSKDTPKEILEGAPAPTLDVPARRARPNAQVSLVTSSPDDPAFWVALAREVPREVFMEMWRQYLLSDDDDRHDADRTHSQGGWPAETPRNPDEVTSP